MINIIANKLFKKSSRLLNGSSDNLVIGESSTIVINIRRKTINPWLFLYTSLREQTKPTNKPDVAVNKMSGLNGSPVEKDDITHKIHAIVIAQKRANKGAKI